MSWLSNLFSSEPAKTNQNAVCVTKSEIIAGSRFSIPEPTRSLVFVTDDSPDKAQALGPSIRITFNLGSLETEREVEEGNIFSEPSLIWTRLPIKPNSDLEDKPMYYPCYVHLNPLQRYQYLSWLQDVTKKTNLSYVFLYYYGLERHLLIGDYDKAVDEILRLIKYHDHDKFRYYVITPLIVASLYRKRVDVFKKADFLSREVSNEALIMRALQNIHLNADDLIKLSSSVGFRNKRYIHQKPELFKEILIEKMQEDEAKSVPILNRFEISQLQKEKISAFCNLSIPERFKKLETPQLLRNKRFEKLIFNLITETHAEVKIRKEV